MIFDFFRKRQQPKAAPQIAYSFPVAATLSTPPMPKLPNKAAAIPSFKTQVARSATNLPKPDMRLANTDITTYRTGASTPEILRNLSVSNPDLGATVNAYLRVGIPESYTIVARNLSGEFNVEATRTAVELLNRMTLLGDPSLGWNPTTDLQSVSESLALEFLLEGAAALELIPDKLRLPSRLAPVSVSKLVWREEDGGVYPVQVIGSSEVKLDIPTFFYVSLDQSLLSPYATPYLQAAIQPVLADAQFMNDLRRKLRRNGNERVVATIIEEKLKSSIHVSIRNDPVKYRETVAAFVDAVRGQLEDLEPEDALTTTDAVKYDTLSPNQGGNGMSNMLEKVSEYLQDKVSSGAKSLNAVLGRDQGASSSTTATMLFLQNANIIRTKLNLLYSRALTMALRMLGEDVIVEFKYAPLDLRPKNELEAYQAMRQSRIVEQLSFGMLSDEEASMMLTGSLPVSMPKLSGTLFRQGTLQIDNPTSQTSVMNGSKDNLKPNTPAQPKS